MYKILLHIGLPKTATSTLQENVLKPLHLRGDIEFLGRTMSPRSKGYFNPFESIYSELHRELTDKEASCLKSKFYSLLSTNKLNVISEERLTVTSSMDLNLKLVNLSKLLSDCDVRVLVSLRTPIDFIFSYYVEMYRWKYQYVSNSNTYKKFVYRLIKKPHAEEFEVFFFAKLIKKLSCFFSEIEIILHEDIKNDPDYYFFQLSRLLDEDSDMLNKMFASARQNVRVKIGEGKYSEKTSFGEHLSKRMVPMFGHKLASFLKQQQAVRIMYKVIVGFALHMKLGKSRFHQNLTTKDTQNINRLICKSNESLVNFGVDQNKLVKYGYLFSENITSV